MKKIIIQSILLLFCLSLIAGCHQQQTNYETDDPFIVVKDHIGGEIHIHDSFPNIYAVDERGKLTLYSETEPDHRLTIGDDAPVCELDVSDEEVGHIKTLIEEHNFWKLDEHLLDDGTMESSSYVTVHLTDESKTVGGYSPADAGFRELSSYVSNLIDYEDYKQWREAMKEHVVELNPEP